MKKKFLFALMMTVLIMMAAGCSRDADINNSSVSDASFDLLNEAKELYDTADSVYFKIIYTRTFFKLGENTAKDYFYEVIDESVNSIEAVKQEVRKTFTESAASLYDEIIDNNFYEENNKLYTFHNSKGGDVSFRGVDLELISSDENTAYFNAVAHYEGYCDITRPFAIVCENGVWKVSEFSSPHRESDKKKK